MKKFIHKANPMDVLNQYHDTVESAKELEYEETEDVEGAVDICGNLDPDSESEQYEFVSRKDVQDSDGLWTEYTLYYDVLNDRYVTVFGDSDLYRPEDEDFDMEFESEAEALEWFDDYDGIYDDDEDVDW